MTFSNRLLSIKAANCINSCTAVELSEMLKEISNDPNCFFGNNLCADPVLCFNVADMLTAYAARYPEQFYNETLASGTDSILISTVQIAILKDDPAAFTLLKKAIMGTLHSKSIPMGGNFKDILSAAALKRRTDCLTYCMDNIENISMLINPELIFYLYDNDMTDVVDILLTGRSKEEIAAIFTDHGFMYSFDSSKFKKNISEYIYETCVRYIPEIRDSDNIPAAVSDFIYFTDRESTTLSILKSRIFTYNSPLNNIRSELSAMKRLGLFFTDITELVLFLNRKSFGSIENILDIVNEIFLPVIKDTAFFRPFYCITNYYVDSDTRNDLFRLFDLIGKDRIRFDIRDKALEASQLNIDEYFNKNHKHIPQLFRRFVSSGIKFVTDDDLREGCAADVITHIPLLLSAMLQQNAFSSDQIYALICKASSEKRTEALNIINKYIISSRK
ncbi:MAG: hypothetical protein J6K92_11300 [Oscillospiraceae bacterium]|nr:hypothetical protein [Oscillospiraceae bacterium]